MEADFQLFGLAHLLILAAIPSLAAVLSALALRSRPISKLIRLSLGILILGNELIWYAHNLSHGWFRFPDALPLQLCDAVLWLTVVALLAQSSWSFEAAYFAGLAGTSMAILTPDLWAPFLSYPTLYFFLAHGSVVLAILFLVWSGLERPGPGSLYRAFGVWNAYAAAMALFNWVFESNYLYLCRKPSAASLLDYLGPWPVYVVAGEGLALGLFALLWLPFRRRGEHTAEFNSA